MTNPTQADEPPQGPIADFAAELHGRAEGLLIEAPFTLDASTVGRRTSRATTAVCIYRGVAMAAKEKPYCQTGPKWIAERLKDKHALAPLTGQDWRALQAFIHLVALYGNSDDAGRNSAVLAMRHTVRAMQPSTRHLAKAVIPHVLDWGDEERIWHQLGDDQAAED